jgi:glycosyltransferase involved in cell wall biosynthesis
MHLSVLTPAFNEADSLPALHARLTDAMRRLNLDWEWLIIDDHSRDGTFDAVRRLAAQDPRVRGLRFARNLGSHVAITCGLHHVRGDAAVMMAADLQDPPETIAAMIERWRAGAQVVWAVRRQQPGERAHAGFAAVYYWVMRHVVGMKEMPARGADFFLVDRVVIDAFRQFPERNVSVLALLTWIGFRQEYIEYDKQPRVAGKSGWTLARKIKLVIDSVTAFSDLPIRLALYGGIALAVLSPVILLAGVLWTQAVASPMLYLLIGLAVVVGLSGVQLIALGLVGAYVWRAYDEARRRPAYLIEALAGDVTVGT